MLINDASVTCTVSSCGVRWRAWHPGPVHRCHHSSALLSSQLMLDRTLTVFVLPLECTTAVTAYSESIPGLLSGGRTGQHANLAFTGEFITNTNTVLTAKCLIVISAGLVDSQ